MIWGTDVVVQHCKDKFRRFLTTYVDAEADEDEKFEGMDIDSPLYMQRLEEVNHHNYSPCSMLLVKLVQKKTACLAQNFTCVFLIIDHS